MNRITVLVIAAVWLSSPAGCFADDANSDNTNANNADAPAQSARSRNAALTPKTRLVGLDNACHRRKPKLTAKLSVSGSENATTIAAPGYTGPAKYVPPQNGVSKVWAVLGPVGAYGPLMRSKTLYRRGW
ncbi:MAG: hypothetical protein U0105_13035 [Candidatus Obscuribacterales bacterium]